MSHTVYRPRRSWPIAVAVVAAVVIIVGGISVLSVMAAGDKPADPASTVPVPTDSPDPVATSSGDDEEPAESLDDADIATIESAIETGATNDIFPFLADPVVVAFAASDFDGEREPDLAVADLDYVAGGTGWDWDLDDAELDAFRAGPYAERFPEGAIIGESAEGYVVSFTVAGPEVTQIFASTSPEFLTEGTK